MHHLDFHQCFMSNMLFCLFSSFVKMCQLCSISLTVTFVLGGRGQIKQKKKTVPQKVTIAKIPRSKKKYVTRVCGLATFGNWCFAKLNSPPFQHFVLNLKGSSSLADIDLKEAQRFFAQTFSCGASVTAEDEIIIQGDFTDDIIDVIQEKWPEVSLLFQMYIFFYTL